MSLVTPLVSYKSIMVGNQSIELSSSAKVSFNENHNRITITLCPINCSLSYYEVRVTAADADYDIGVGALAYWDANLQANVDKTFQIAVNSTNFSLGDGAYRISLYAKSALDGSWDMSYILFTVASGQFTLSDGSAFAVLTTRDAPTHN